MLKLALVLLLCAALGYLIAAVGLQRATFVHNRVDFGPWRKVLWAGLALHTLGLGLFSVAMGHLPITHVAETFAPLSWVLMFLYLALGERWHVEVVGTVAAPAACVMTLFSAGALWGERPAPVTSFWIKLHVMSIILGYASFILAAACALLYFLQARNLKAKKLGGLFSVLPPLDTLDQVAYRFIRAGFPLMVVGIATGVLLNGWTWKWDLQETVVAATGLVYTLYLHARIAGWRGRKVNSILLLAFVCVLASLFIPGASHN